MYSLNRATILGNLTRDPEVRTTTTGQNVCTFAVATNRQWKDASGQKQEKADYHDVVVWGKLADICGQYLKRGRKAYIEGRLQTRDWEGQDGVKRFRTEIIPENVILLDRSEGGGAGASFTKSADVSPSGFSDDPAPNPDDEIKVEDIPF